MTMLEHILNKIRSEGFAFISEWHPSLSTEQVASRLGNILDIEKHLPGSGIENVQKLRPRKPSVALMNQYSGLYGLNEFPFHSDLAHWHMPPRYLVLRCIHGSKDILTRLLTLPAFERMIGANVLKFALVVPRRKSKTQTICPMPIKFNRNEVVGVRWDLLFLRPLNDAAREAYQIMSSKPWNEQEVIPACLEKPGDTLIIDNWKTLHSRSPVPTSSQSREIERVYLNRIGE